MDSTQAITGFILGTALGDALGLPREGLSRRRAARLFGDGPLRHRFILGRGLISDDTEHTCMVAQALLASRGDPDAFARSLAWRLRGWLLALPAGVGLATLKASLRLWVGCSWRTSGVFSAGNGPAMRAGILGLYAGDDDELLRELVHRSTRITHTDPLAEEGALLVALAARHAVRRRPAPPDRSAFSAEARAAIRDERLLEMLERMSAALSQEFSADEFANLAGMTNGVSGYILNTVPASLFCWLRHADSFRDGVEAVIRLGGDTDSTGAITGGLLGATLGWDGLPADWLAGLCEWPRSTKWLARLGARLVSSMRTPSMEVPLPLFWPGVMPRNLVFLSVALMHGLRRMFPPY